MALNPLLNKTADTDRGVKTYKSTRGCEQAIRWHSEPLYSVATMLDARYKDSYFDADKKQGLPDMLQTQLNNIKRTQ